MSALMEITQYFHIAFIAIKGDRIDCATMSRVFKVP